MEKAEILELAIRCLEGKREQAESDFCLSKTSTAKRIKRNPLSKLENASLNTIQSSNNNKAETESTTLRIKRESQENEHSQRHVPVRYNLLSPTRSLNTTDYNDDYMKSNNLNQRSAAKTGKDFWRPWTI